MSQQAPKFPIAKLPTRARPADKEATSSSPTQARLPAKSISPAPPAVLRKCSLDDAPTNFNKGLEPQRSVEDFSVSEYYKLSAVEQQNAYRLFRTLSDLFAPAANLSADLSDLLEHTNLERIWARLTPEEQVLASNLQYPATLFGLTTDPKGSEFAATIRSVHSGLLKIQETLKFSAFNRNLQLLHNSETALLLYATSKSSTKDDKRVQEERAATKKVTELETEKATAVKELASLKAEHETLKNKYDGLSKRFTIQAQCLKRKTELLEEAHNSRQALKQRLESVFSQTSPVRARTPSPLPVDDETEARTELYANDDFDL